MTRAALAYKAPMPEKLTGAALEARRAEMRRTFHYFLEHLEQNRADYPDIHPKTIDRWLRGDIPDYMLWLLENPALLVALARDATAYTRRLIASNTALEATAGQRENTPAE